MYDVYLRIPSIIGGTRGGSSVRSSETASSPCTLLGSAKTKFARFLEGDLQKKYSVVVTCNILLFIQHEQHVGCILRRP